MKPQLVELQIVQGVEGRSVYLNDFRIAGNKPWGGGNVEYTFRILIGDLARALHIDEGKFNALFEATAQGGKDEGK